MESVLLLVPPPHGQYQYRDLLFGETSPLDFVEFPLVLAYAASSLEAAGIDATLLDANAMELSLKEVLARIKQLGPTAIVMSATSTSLEPVLAMSASLREAVPRARQVLVGLIAPSLYERALEHVDALVTGDCEAALVELFSSTWDPLSVPGCVWREKGRMEVNPPGPPVKLDALPFPSRHLLPMDRYVQYLGRRSTRYTSLITSRGCVHHCTFCSRSFTRERVWSGRSAENVADEFEEVRRHHGIREVRLYDEDFFHDRERALAIAREIERRQLDMDWIVTGRVDGVDREVTEALARAGCYRIDFGVESADPDILRSTGKGVVLKTVRQAFDAAHAAGIEAGALLIIGLPGESWETVRATVSFVQELEADFVIFRSVLPYPDTPLAALAARKGWLDDNGHLSRPEFSAEDVRRATRWAYRSFYLDPAFMARRASRSRDPLEMGLLVRSFWKFLKFYGGLGSSHRSCDTPRAPP